MACDEGGFRAVVGVAAYADHFPELPLRAAVAVEGDSYLPDAVGGSGSREYLTPVHPQSAVTRRITRAESPTFLYLIVPDLGLNLLKLPKSSSLSSSCNRSSPLSR